MTSLQQPASGVHGLPPDQRAVLEMVLGRGHSYDEIAGLLKIDRAGVRRRALSALDALGPVTRVSAERRALITDYLLGQLPTRVADEVRDHLGRSASERAWARVVASELAPLASAALPTIPAGQMEPESSADARAAAAETRDAGSRDGEQLGAAQPARPVSRLGGAILLGAVGAAIIAAILIFVVFGVGGTTSHNKPAAKKPAATTAATANTASTKPLAQINLISPSHTKAVGIAEVIKAGNATGVVIVAQGLKANTGKDAYAIWLYNSPSSAYRLGYVRPGVTSSGRLQTAGRLPANASSYKQIVVALQHGPSNKPGTTVLRGTLSGV
jgi:Sigma-70, region 4